jgi:hypothetical protein
LPVQRDGDRRPVVQAREKAVVGELGELRHLQRVHRAGAPPAVQCRDVADDVAGTTQREQHHLPVTGVGVHADPARQQHQDVVGRVALVHHRRVGGQLADTRAFEKEVLVGRFEVAQ